VRFTGRVFAEDVNALAREVAVRSGIRDVTDIPIGYEVKIPFHLLLPEFLPTGHPERREYERGLLASAQFSNEVTANRLNGVTVVLDAGHGGKDVGASVSGIWESLYVYDIMVRTMKLLESSTAATVIATTQEGTGHSVAERDQLTYSKGHRVLTTPNYQIEDSRVGVHLRWYLANSIYRQAVEKGGDPDKVVFVSIHADSLHPSLRGAMVYIPGARYRSGTYGKSGAVYASRSEYKERPQVSYSDRERVRSEGLSRELASNILGAFHDRGLAVHADKPVREKVIRQQRAWVPAVLRYNAIPSEVLLEVCNLANTEDRNLIQTAGFRQQVAEAIVRGILSYYGQAEGDQGLRVAVAGR
jgi:N-acetylmuramoyl-L-alanine amidase